MLKRTLFLLTVCGSLAACGGKEEPKQASASVMKLMRDEVQPTAEIYWNSAGYVTDEQGERDLTPTTDEGWKATQDAAVKLAAYGELLKTPEYAEGRGDAWIRFADGLIEVSKQAEKAAVNRNSDAVFEVGGTVYNVCSACHQAYPPVEAEQEAKTATPS